MRLRVIWTNPGRHLRYLVLRSIPAKAFDQASQDQIAVAFQHHVDEVDNDDPPMSRRRGCRTISSRGFEVVLGDRLLEISSRPGELPGVRQRPSSPRFDRSPANHPTGARPCDPKPSSTCSSTR